MRGGGTNNAIRSRNSLALSRSYKNAGQLVAGLTDVARAARVPTITNRVGTMFTTFFAEKPITNWETAKVADKQKYGVFFRAMLENGVYLAPSQFEAGFLSTMHGEAEINATLAAAEKALQAVSE